MSLQFGALETQAAEENSISAFTMDESAFRIFYEQTSTPLLRYLTAVTRKTDAAEDILQEAYCRFLTAHIRNMDEQRARSYLFRIATNLLHDRWRGSRGNKESPLPDHAQQMSSAHPHFERKLHLRQAFGRLKPRERQLLWLAYVEGSNHKEIADCTGLRAGSIRLLLFRARRRLLEFVGAPRAPKVDR